MSKKICTKENHINQDKYFAILGFTTLTGKPATRVITFAGAYQNPHAESGIDVTKKYEGDATDSRFFENNFGTGKTFPRGPACRFGDKKWICFVCWSEKGGITSSILIDTLRQFDNREV